MEPVATDIERRIQQQLRTERPIPRSAELYHDLRIMGDDASELLEGIAGAYGVSFEGFRFRDHFPDEGSAGLHGIGAWFGFRDRQRKSFTVAHLIAVVERRAWFEPPRMREAV